jgi:hypothetical protein
MPIIRTKPEGKGGSASIITFLYEPGSNLIARGRKKEPITITPAGVKVTVDQATAALNMYTEVEKVPE